MKNELLQQRDCLKYWEKYGQHTLLYPLAPRSGSEALLSAPHGTFPTPGPEQLLTTMPFFIWHKVFLGILALSEWRAFGPKTRRSHRVGRRREVFVYSSPRHWALSINQPSLTCLAAGMRWLFSPQTFPFVSGRGAHGKVCQEIKAAKVVFSHTTAAGLRVVVYSSPCHPISSFGGAFSPGGVPGASLNSDERQHIFCVPASIGSLLCSVPIIRTPSWVPWWGFASTMPWKGLRCPGSPMESTVSVSL